MLKRLKVRLRRLLRPDELNEELQLHLDQLTDVLISQGMTPDEAKRSARLSFGNATSIAQRSRETTSFGALEDLFRDIVFALRSWRRTPGMILVAVLSIGLGIGANSALFSLADALVLRALPVSDPWQLVCIVNPNSRDFGFPPIHYERLLRLNQHFSGVAAIHNFRRANVDVNQVREISSLEVALISENYLDVLGIQPVLGRVAGPREPTPSAMITYGYWERRFGRDPRVLGTAVAVGSSVFTIVGVTAPGFSGDAVGKAVDLWIPLAMQSAVMIDRPQREVPWLRVIARLQPGAQIEQAQAAAQAAYLGAVQDTPGLRPQIRQTMLQGTVEIESAARGFAPQRHSLRKPLIIAGVIVGFALLIACANVANLLLARSAARQREIDMRLALGAGRFRIVKQLLTESLLLAFAGGLLGFLFAIWLTKVATRLAASGLDPIALDTQPDARLIGFGFVLTIISAVLAGFAPAWSASSGDLVRSTPARLRAPVLALQVALTLALLAGAGVFTATLRNLRSQELGFERENLLLVWTAPEQAGYRGRTATELFRTLPERVALLPGVASASASLIGPLEGAYSDDTTGPTPNIVAPGFFKTVGMRLLGGRDFNRHDTEESGAVAIISEAFARELFGEENALGRRIEFRRSSLQIVGIVSDTKFNAVREKRRRMLFIPYTQDPDHLFSLCVVIRTEGNSPAELARRVRDEIRGVGRGVPVTRIDSLAEQLDRSLIVERSTAALANCFAILTAGVASIGFYGLVSFSVTRRIREIGVRMTLGATGGQIIAMVLRQVALTAGAGVLLGTPLALLVMRLSRTLLFGISADDPMVLAGSVGLMLVVVVLATIPPALRAAWTNPSVALRYE